MKRFQKNMMAYLLILSASLNVCISHYEANNRHFNFANVGGEDVNISMAMFRSDDLKFIKQCQKHL